MVCAAALAAALGVALAGAAGVAAVAPAYDEAKRLHLAGRLDEALAAYDAVAAEPRTALAEAAAARNNACLILTGRGEYRRARERCAQAVELRRRQGDEGALARALNNLGLAHRFLGVFEEAERQFVEALEINRRLGDAEAQAVNLANLGVTAEAAGRYAAALDAHRQAEALAEAHGAAAWAPRQRQIARVNQGVVLEKIDAFRAALDLYERVDETALAPADRALLNENKGVIYRNLGDPVSALAAYGRAEALYEGLGNRSARANARLNVGIVHHLNLGRRRQAESDYAQALALARRSGDLEVEMRALYFLGRLLLSLDRAGDAEQAFRSALAAAQRSRSAEGSWSAREGLARVAHRRGDLDAALAHALAAIAEIERVREGLSRAAVVPAAAAPPGRLASEFFGARRPVYALAVEALAGLAAARPGRGFEERALELVQRAKARDLLDSLGWVPGGSLRRAVAPMTVGQIRAELGPGEWVLEYFAGETRLYLWEVGASGVAMHDLGPAAAVRDRSADVYEAVAGGREPAAADLDWLARALLGKLQGGVQAPAGPVAAGAAAGEPPVWWISPDQALQVLPFEMLAHPAGGLVLERVVVSYVPSASALAWLTGEQHRHTFALAGFGDPEPPAAGSVSRAGVIAASFRLGRLPAAGRELDAARRWLGGRAEIRLGRRADESEFRRLAQAGARVVHLVAHTVLDERPGQGAAILLAESAGDDGLVHPAEIARLDYRVDLTVLAACRSAFGWGEGGSSLASLLGAFLAAGSAGVVATLWDVGDAATATFMEQFYYELGQGLAPAAALRAAKLRLRADSRWSAARLWAPYILVGQPPPVRERRLLRPELVAAALAAGVAAAALAWARMGRGRRAVTRPPAGSGS